MGLLDWLTDGGGSLFGSGTPSTPQPDAAMQPPVARPDDFMRPTGPQIPPMSWQQPNPPSAIDPSASGSPAPPSMGAPSPPPPAPFPQGGDPVSGSGSGNSGGLPPPPIPQPRPAGANAPPAPGAIPPPPPEQPPGPPMNIAAPPMVPPQESGGIAPDMQNRGGLLQAMGLSSDVASRMRGGLGAGLKAAGNSAGKSPVQALAGGAGEAMEGGKKSSDTNTDQTIKYLNAAINAQKAGDTNAYNLNYTKYLAAKLKADTDKAASGNAAKNSPEQLYFQAVRATNADPALKGYNDAIRAARASGDTAALAKAQADLEKAKGDVMNGHLGRVGLDPIAAAKIGQQPGMNPGNALDAGKLGITEKNIAQKLQPGQYYRNPKDGQIYQFTGGPGAGKGIPEKPTTPEPRDPNKPERGSRAAAPETADEAEG